MQEMWKKIRPEVLRALRESAVIQSAESSNRIEGVVVPHERLIPLVLGEIRPKDRPEEEIVGYRKALNYVHKGYKTIELSSKTMLHLHSLAQGGLIGDAGKWKAKDNEIIEFSPRGERTVRFRPTAAKETPRAAAQLCLGYQDTIRQNALPDLIAVASFILDFLCIHPFRDGNGRVSRLLTLLLLLQNGHEVGRFISLERIIEDSKEDYYEALRHSSVEWHAGQHDPSHWWNYFLSVTKEAYKELKTRVELSSSGDTKSALIRQTVSSLEEPFSVRELCRILPGVDRELVKKVLYSMRDEGALKMEGKGRSARWKRRR